MYKIKLGQGSREQEPALNSSESGRVQLKVVLWIVIIGLAGYAIYTFVPMYASYKMLQYEVEGEAKIAHMYSNAEIKDRILEKAVGWSVDLNKSDIEIIRDYQEIQIALSYEVGVVFFGRFDKTFYFDIYAIEPLKQQYGK